MLCHRGHAVRDVSSRAPHAGVFEKNHLASLGQRISHCGVPIVQSACEMLKTQQGNARANSEAPIGILFERGLDELCRCRDVACFEHFYVFLEFLPNWAGRKLSRTSRSRQEPDSKYRACRARNTIGPMHKRAIQTSP